MSQDRPHSGEQVFGTGVAGSPIVVQAGEHELRHLRHEWWWFLVLGILLVLSGGVALAYPFLASVAVVTVLGVSLLLSGIATIVAAFWAGKWSALLLQLLIGVFYTVLGFIVMDTPLTSTISLTLVVAILFVVIGIMRAVAALAIRFPQWGWSLLSGVLSALVGLVIYKNLPGTALWAIGTLVGIQLLFDGVFWIMLSLAIRRLARSAP
jgi:uncharacterized membrane protein HdeD (DUF308 family)